MTRSTLPRDAARSRYVEIGELAALEQIREDAEALDRHLRAIGPFARLDANAVAARDGKTRGAITNLFGSQAAFQAETMALALSAGDWIERLALPDPSAFDDADAWVDALFGGESARGPRHDAAPEPTYGFLWSLWLSTVPYGLWSERVSAPSMDEHAQFVRKLEEAFAGALEAFGVRLRAGTTVGDLACAAASLVEGVWLNQCLTDRHPIDGGLAIADVLRRGGRMLWRGATLVA